MEKQERKAIKESLSASIITPTLDPVFDTAKEKEDPIADGSFLSKAQALESRHREKVKES